MFKNKDGEVSVPKIIGWSVVAIILVTLIFGSFGTVGAGERGVKTRFSGVTGTVLQPGLYFKLPLVEGVEKMNVQIQKEAADLNAASKDLQTVTSKVALNYHLDPSKVVSVYRDVGYDYNIRLIDPALQESLKSSTAKFTAEELIQKREEARQNVKDLLVEKLAPHGIVVDEFNMVNFSFSPSFETAIEAKVTTEQNALAAKNKLDQVRYEADQRVAAADGEAKAIAIQAAAIQNQGGAAYIQLKGLEVQSEAIKKWNGILPVYQLSGVTPFINLNK